MPVVPITVKVAFALLGIGLIIFLVGFATPYWYYREFDSEQVLRAYGVQAYRSGEQHQGLWRMCFDWQQWSPQRPSARRTFKGCGDFLGSTDVDLNDELRATQFFETAGFLAILPAILLLVLGMCIDSCKERRILPVLSAVLCLVAGGCIILGAIIFGATDVYKDFLSWSFALAIIGGIFFAVAGVLVIVGAILKK